MSLNPYSYFIDLKNFLYDHQIFKSLVLESPVISVGNLNTGGSGKTPFIQFLARELRSKKILIVSKSYKAALAAPARVDIHKPQAADFFGDEPVLLQTTLPDVEVWSGPRKFETAQEAVQHKKFDVIFVDDGFSHRQLQKSVNIVLVDVSRSLEHYRLLPLGRMREGWKSLKRADCVVLTRTHLVSKAIVEEFKKLIRPYHAEVLIADYLTALASPQKNIYLFAGIGNPEGLLLDLKSLGYQVEQKNIFADHHKYTPRDEAQILAELSAAPGLQAVTTEKDFVKLQNKELKARVICVQLEVKMSAESSRILNEKIRKIF